MKAFENALKSCISLSMLSPTEDSAARLQGDAIQMLQMAEDLPPTDGFVPPATALPHEREDVAGHSLPRSQALQNAPKTDGEYFLA